jgi:hypothetical protein
MTEPWLLLVKVMALQQLKNKTEIIHGSGFFSLNYILHQEAICAKSLKMTHIMDAVVKTVNLFVQVPLTIVNF